MQLNVKVKIKKYLKLINYTIFFDDLIINHINNYFKINSKSYILTNGMYDISYLAASITNLVKSDITLFLNSIIKKMISI